MDKQFEQWIKEFDESFIKSESYKTLVGKGYSESIINLLGWYLQYKQQQSSEKLVYWTRLLVLGTWVLCGITLLLVKFG